MKQILDPGLRCDIKDREFFLSLDENVISITSLVLCMLGASRDVLVNRHILECGREDGRRGEIHIM